MNDELEDMLDSIKRGLCIVAYVAIAAFVIALAEAFL